MSASPQQVVQQFLETLIVQADMDAIWQYVCAEARKHVHLAIQRTHNDTNLERTRVYYSHAKCDLSSLKIEVTQQEANTATVCLKGRVYARYTKARFSISPERIYDRAVIHLRKIDDKWLICHATDD